MDMNARRSAAAHDHDDEEEYAYDLSNAIYGHFPVSPRRSRATSPNSSEKRKSTTSTTTANRQKTPASWLPHQHQHFTQRKHTMSIHQSTCLNLNMSASTSAGGQPSESDLWILPELDDWEEGDETEESSSSQATLSPSSSQSSVSTNESIMEVAKAPHQNKWAGVLFRRAAKSNLERLRMRMEGEGWEFLGSEGKRGGEGEESVDDDEFDVVVVGDVSGA